MMNPVLLGTRVNSSRVHYFSGNDPAKWRTNIPTYGAVIYKNVYPGIDWMFYEREGNLEYDFLLSPGANPSQIRLMINGAEKLETDSSGNLNIQTASGSLQMLTPAVFQENIQISTRYQKTNANEIQFLLEGYNPEKPLTIDPILTFGTFLGGNTFDTIADVGVDNAGNFYAVGYTEVNTRFPGFGDGVVYKFNPSGSLLWSAFLAGSGGDSADAIAVTPNGTSYVAGATSSRDFPTVGAFQLHNGGGNDAFVVKLAPNGAGIIRSSYLGGSGNETVKDIKLGTGPKLRNGVYVIGTTNSRNFPLKNATQNQFGGGNKDGYLAIVHALNFQRLMSTYIGHNNSEEITSIAPNTIRGDLYTSVVNFDGADSYISQFKPAGGGVPISSYKLVEHTNSATSLRAARCDPLSAALFLVWFHNLLLSFTESPVAMNVAAQPGIGAVTCGCIPKPPATTCTDNGGLLFLDQDLNPLGSVNFGGTGQGTFFVNDVTNTNNGTMYIVGDTTIKNLPVLNAFQGTNKGGSEGFLIVLQPGTYQTSLFSYLGGTGADFARGVAVDKAGNILIVGETNSKKFPTTPGAPDRTLNGTADGFVVKVNP